MHSTGIGVLLAISIIACLTRLSICQAPPTGPLDPSEIKYPCGKYSGCKCRALDMKKIACSGADCYRAVGTGGEQWDYLWNPCGVLPSAPTDCSGNSVCQTNARGTYPCGVSTKQSIVCRNRLLAVQYDADITDSPDGQSRRSVIYLTCGSTNKGDFASYSDGSDTEEGYYLYVMELKTKLACGDAIVDNVCDGKAMPGGGGGTGSASISLGGVLLIIFLVPTGVYFIFGTAYLTFYKKETELSGRVPNYS